MGCRRVAAAWERWAGGRWVDGSKQVEGISQVKHARWRKHAAHPDLHNKDWALGRALRLLPPLPSR